MGAPSINKLSNFFNRINMRLIKACLLIPFLTACGTSSIAPGSTNEATQRQVEEYRLDTGDQVRLIVFGEDNLSGEFVVNGSGKVSLPLIGEIAAARKTTDELKYNIQNALADGYLKNPRVNIELLTYRPFYVLGEVENSGEYPYSEDMTVLNAVATAGGYTYRANTKTVFIKRPGARGEERFSLTATTPVQPGDTIRIGERLF